MTHRVQLQPSFLLHRRPFRDSSQLLEVFSLEYGRVSLVARGVSRRRRGGALASLLQPFRPLLLSYAGRGELATLTGAEAAGNKLAAPTGERLFSALYINELLTRLLHRHEAHAALFAAYGRTLEALSSKDPVAAALRRFELELLDELGYGVELERESRSGMSLEPGTLYRVDPEIGVCEAVEVRERDRELFGGEALLAIAQGRVDGPFASDAKRLTRLLLAPHLGTEPLRSRMFFRRSSALAVGSRP
jgi:DNA repair protein RecO (recombination protein O)